MLTKAPECVISVYIEVVFGLCVAMIEAVREGNHSRPGQPVKPTQILELKTSVHTYNTYTYYILHI